MIARDPNTGKWRDYAKELIHGIPQHAPDSTPPGKPYAELTMAEDIRLREIEEDMGLMMAEWESICNDRFPIVHNMVPAED